MRGGKALLSAVLSAALAAALFGPAVAQTGDEDRGEAIYAQRCMGCHGMCRPSVNAAGKPVMTCDSCQQSHTTKKY